MLKMEQKAVAKPKLNSVEVDAAELREIILRTKNTIETGFLTLAKGLAEVQKFGLHQQWGFPTFAAYISTELDFSYRKARYLVGIWEKVQELNLPEEKITKMGWSKAVELTKVLSKDNVDLWMEKADELTFAKLEAEVKDELDRAAGIDKPRIVTMVFRLDTADSGIVGDALTESKRIHETDSDVLALSQICGEWLILKGKSPVRSSVQDYVELVKRAFGVSLVIESDTLVPDTPKAKDTPSVEDYTEDVLYDDETVANLLVDD